MTSFRTHFRRIIGHHLIFSSYGVWLANDPRGSGSAVLRQSKFEDLGPIHPGRKREQPTREKLRGLYEEATPRLEFAPLWFGEDVRQAIAESFARTTQRYRYTAWGLAVLSNHVHLCVRAHRDCYETIWARYAEAGRDAASRIGRTIAKHPVWANRPYSVFLYCPDDVWRTVGYIEDNPVKEGLGRQVYRWVVTYNGWPFAKGV